MEPEKLEKPEKAAKAEKVEQKKDVAVNPEKMKALQATLDKIEKEYGKGTIMKMGDKAISEVPTISSGSIALDIALGIGGLPVGRIAGRVAGDHRCADRGAGRTGVQRQRGAARRPADPADDRASAFRSCMGRTRSPIC